MAHQMTSRIYIYLLGMFFFCVADAQEDLESLLDELAPLPPQEVMATFKSGKVINLHPMNVWQQGIWKCGFHIGLGDSMEELMNCGD